ncbi:MAG: branched-chain amino acid ABC transporter permease [Proteobacteria bacterium]|jgi:branched-chain amino acid transport system permease protein|nr:branched-chain amino acid ABC transporter permease [Pseudomonadota bacterium]
MDAVSAMYIAQGIHGLAYGMMLFLIAAGLTLIFGMMGILNLAHAGFFMLSAYFAYQISVWGGNYWVALIFAPIITGFIGALVERFLLRKIVATGLANQLLLTQALVFVIIGLVQAKWGTEYLPFSAPESLNGLVNIAGMQYPEYRLFMIGVSFALLLFMIFILYKTRLGMIVRAAVSDAEMVNALGINVPLVFMVVFGVGTWMAGLAGVVIAPVMSVHPYLGDQVGMDAFVVVITGGFGSLGGAFLVAIVLGLLNAYGIQFVSQYAMVITFVFMAVVLAIKPTGLFGERE